MCVLFEVPSHWAKGAAKALACIMALSINASAFAAPMQQGGWQTPGPPPCTNSHALGTSRIASVGTQGGLAVGLKTYPRTLRLTDHEIVLTFDDGPLPRTTAAILDALARECVLATFFVIGRNAEAHPELVRREIAAGHTVGHHSFSHPAGTLRGLSEAAARLEIARGIEADEKAAGLWQSSDVAPRVPFFRFPGLADTRPLLEWLNAQSIAVFSADIWASDWNAMTPDAELDLLLARIERAKRGIVLLHDIKAQTAVMLPRLLEELKRRNYRIVHLVPGVGRAETIEAPGNWTSATEAFVTRVTPHAGRVLNRRPPSPPIGPGSAETAARIGSDNPPDRSWYYSR